jgi:molecular chaperone GrpE
MSPAQDGPREPRPAGPVAEDGTSSSQAAGKDPSSTPPTGGASARDVPDRGADSPPSDQGAANQVEQDLDSLLADTQRERDEYLDLAKRTKADFENFRRRMTAETAAAAARGKADLIREVVPVLDDLERALQAAGLDPEGDSPDGLAHGVLLVFRSLREGLARNGVERLDPSGEAFDPQHHEAISTLPGSGAEPGTVVEVVQKGYRLGDQLVRPARVVVAE